MQTATCSDPIPLANTHTHTHTHLLQGISFYGGFLKTLTPKNPPYHKANRRLIGFLGVVGKISLACSPGLSWQLEINSSLLETTSPPLQINSLPLQIHSSSRQFDSSPPHIGSSPPETNSSPLQMNSSPLRINWSPLERNSSPLQMNSCQQMANLSVAKQTKTVLNGEFKLRKHESFVRPQSVNQSNTQSVLDALAAGRLPDTHKASVCYSAQRSLGVRFCVHASRWNACN